MTDLHRAIGQYLIYRTSLQMAGRTEELWVAAPAEMRIFFGRPAATKLRQDFGINVFIYHSKREEILEWLTP